MSDLPSLKATAALKYLLTSLQLSHEDLKFVEKEVTKARQFGDHRIELEKSLPHECASRVHILDYEETSDYNDMVKTKKTSYSIRVDDIGDPVQLLVEWEHDYDGSTEDIACSKVDLHLTYRGITASFKSKMRAEEEYGESSSTHDGARQLFRSLAEDLKPDQSQYTEQESRKWCEFLRGANRWDLDAYEGRDDIKPLDPESDEDKAVLLVTKAFLIGVNHASVNVPEQGYMSLTEAILREWTHDDME